MPAPSTFLDLWIKLFLQPTKILTGGDEFLRRRRFLDFGGDLANGFSVVSERMRTKLAKVLG